MIGRQETYSFSVRRLAFGIQRGWRAAFACTKALGRILRLQLCQSLKMLLRQGLFNVSSADFPGAAERQTRNAPARGDRTVSRYQKTGTNLAPRSLRILLIGNFIPEHQHSMLQFEDHLMTGLKERGVAVTSLRPSPFFSRLWTRNRLIRKWLAYLDKFVLFPFRLVMRRSTPNEIIHICDHSNAMYLTFLSRRRSLVTCHDLLAVRNARGEFSVHRAGWTGRILQHLVLRGLRRTKMLVCDSEATRSDVLRIIGPSPPSQVINMCVAEAYFSAGQRRNAERQTGPPFLLHVGGTQWYKNRPIVRRIYCRLRERMGGAAPDLLIIGEGDSTPPQFGEELLSDLPVSELVECYRRAALVLFPSYAEGFGLPIVEAQASGCLVVTTGLPPMNEIGGEGAFYVADPENVEGFVEAISEVLRLDSAEAQRRRMLGYQNAERFRTDAMVAGYLRLYQKLVNRESITRH